MSMKGLDQMDSDALEDDGRDRPHPDRDEKMLSPVVDTSALDWGKRRNGSVMTSAGSMADTEHDGDAHAAEEELHRRESDLLLYNELALEGFEGHLWARLSRDLAHYGYAVLMSWLNSGEMFAHCRAKQCNPGSPPERDRWDQDDRAGLANLSVTTGIKNFKERGLIGGGWDPRGKASLRTYFIGACILAFSNHYRSWRSERDREPLTIPLDEDPRGLSTHAVDPADRAIVNIQIRDGLRAIPDERTRMAISLQEYGLTYQEIADLLETSVKSIEGLLQRQRARGRSQGFRRRRS